MVAQHPKTDKPCISIADIAAGDAACLTLRVSVMLDRAGQAPRGTEFWHAARRLKSYDQVLALAREYAELL